MDKSVTGIVTGMIHSLLKDNLQDEGDDQSFDFLVALFFVLWERVMHHILLAIYILKHTYCAAVLTENGFMDSEASLAFLESDEGKRDIVALHVEWIIDKFALNCLAGVIPTVGVP